MSLKDGLKKMSKSEPSDQSRINLNDNESQIVTKIKKAKTDPLPLPSTIKELEKRPEAKNLLGIFSSLSGQTLEKSVNEFSGKNFSKFKENLSQLLVDKIVPISSEIKKLLNDKNFLEDVLLNGCGKADAIASKKLKKIHEIVGF
tara:strand:- start:1351 stop:1785 length:435 start_codon:yes stop_codon:yes gene_type:complete